VWRGSSERAQFAARPNSASLRLPPVAPLIAPPAPSAPAAPRARTPEEQLAELKAAINQKPGE